MSGKKAPEWFGEVAQSIAPIGMMMAIFMLVYSVWFGFAWGEMGVADFWIDVTARYIFND
jgi:hypothetical protein